MKKDTRNYGKFHPRFFKGGSVASAEELKELERDRGERATRENLLMHRFADIDRQGKGTPNEYESEQNRSKSIVQEPQKYDVIPEEDLVEDSKA